MDAAFSPYLKASNTQKDDQFGYSVAVSGDTVVVGAYGDENEDPFEIELIGTGSTALQLLNGYDQSQIEALDDATVIELPSLGIVHQQVPQFGGLPDGEIGPALQEAIPGILEDGFVAFGGELLGFLPPHLIDGLTKLLGNVKAVQHVERDWQHGSDDVERGFPHVGTHDLDFGTTLHAKGLEEAGEGMGVAIPDDAEKAFASAVDLGDDLRRAAISTHSDGMVNEALEAVDFVE